MATASPARIFLSYARRDGAELAQRLHQDLAARGYDTWLDTRRIRPGATWTREIERALDASQVVLALLTPGSYISEICRAEQLRSLRHGQCVIPLLAAPGTDIPLHLETRNYLDFADPSSYRGRLEQLLATLGEGAAGAGVVLPEPYRRTYVTAPPLPINFVERPDALAALRNALFSDDSPGGAGRHIALTALRGMGGLGKTVLAQALCHDQVVQHAFPDGIIWVSVGKESTLDALARLREVGKALKDDLARYDTALGATNQYRSTLQAKAVLVVVDDIWSTADLEPLLAESPRSRLLFTTRNAAIAAAVGANEHVAELLTEEQSQNVLARWAGLAQDRFPAAAGQVVRECGRLPLALAMVGAMLRGQPAGMWPAVLDLLRRAELEGIAMEAANPAHRTLFRALGMSVEALPPATRERYLRLAVLLEDMAAEPAVQQALWGGTLDECLRTAGELMSLSLAQPEGDRGALRLHDLQLDYLRRLHPDPEALELIHGAVRLSSHVIAQDPSQFASQMVGRLLAHEGRPGIASFAWQLRDHASRPWLRPLWPALDAPGGALRRTLVGHSSFVVGVAMSADGRKAVSASHDRTLKVWALESGRLLHTLEGHAGEVMQVAVSADGRRAVSASNDRTLKVWDLESWQLLRTLKLYPYELCRRVAVSADGRLAVSDSSATPLTVWELESGRLLRTLEGARVLWGFAVSADGRQTVSASSDDTLKVWELESGRLLHTLEGHFRGVSAVVVSADGRQAVSASSADALDDTLKVWELESGRLLHTLKGHSGKVEAMAVSADGRLVVSARFDTTPKVWELQSGRLLHTLKGHSGWVNSVAVSADGRQAISASHDKTLKVWDLGGAHLPHLFVHGHSGPITCVGASADGRRAVSASDDCTLGVWDLQSGRLLRTLEGHSGAVLGVTVSADGRRAVSASYDWTLKVWELESGRLLSTLEGHSSAVWAVAVSVDGRHAVSASDDGTLNVWKLGSGRLLHTLKVHFHWVRAVAVSADGRQAVWASDGRTLEVWELESGRLLHTLEGHSGWVRAVAVRADGRQAVSASEDKTLKVWELESGRLLRTLEGHSGSVEAVALSADGQHAVSGSADRTLKVWNLYTSAALATFTCEAAPRCCAFAGPDRIVAGDAAGRLYHFAFVS
jgi:WD40 repeat protein